MLRETNAARAQVMPGWVRELRCAGAWIRAAPRAGRPARAGARDTRPLAGCGDLRAVAEADGGRAGLDLLRGAADRQRAAGRAPCRGADLQGPVPAVQDHAGPSRPAPGRVGLPRAAGRSRGGKRTRPDRQAGHRGVRGRGVQRALPRVRAPVRRRVAGDVPADGLLGRHRARLPDHGPELHRVGLVVAQGHLRAGAAGPRLPDQPLLPALRHSAVRPRDGPGRRLPDGHRPGHHGQVPAC